MRGGTWAFAPGQDGEIPTGPKGELGIKNVQEGIFHLFENVI